MTDLTLDDRTFEHDDGTWTTLELSYQSPWQAGDDGWPCVSISIKTFQRQPGRGFDFKAEPQSRQYICLNEVNIGLLAGYLTAVNELLWRQWTQQQQQKPTKPTGD